MSANHPNGYKKKFFRSIFFSILISLLSFTNAYSQNIKIESTNIGIEYGLAQSAARHIIQDSKGFMWICTYNGLNRYDGYQFVTYKNESNNSNSLSDDQTRCIYEDKKGIIWMGAVNGLNRLDPYTQKFSELINNSGIVTNYTK